MSRKGALLIGGLAILLNVLIALGGILFTELVVGEFSLKGAVAIQEAKTKAVCASLLFNAVGTQYSSGGAKPDSPSSAKLLAFYGTNEEARQFGLTDTVLERYAEEGLYIGICSGEESEFKKCIDNMKITHVFMDCEAKVYHPDGGYEPVYIRVGEGVIQPCEEKGGMCRTKEEDTNGDGYYDESCEGYETVVNVGCGDEELVCCVQISA